MTGFNGLGMVIVGCRQECFVKQAEQRSEESFGHFNQFLRLLCLSDHLYLQNVSKNL